MKCPLGKTPAYILFVFWVNVVWVVGIGKVDDYCHAGMFEIKGLSLGFA